MEKYTELGIMAIRDTVCGVAFRELLYQDAYLINYPDVSIGVNGEFRMQGKHRLFFTYRFWAHILWLLTPQPSTPTVEAIYCATMDGIGRCAAQGYIQTVHRYWVSDWLHIDCS